MPKANKTNAMRQLDTRKIVYELVTYEVDEEHLEGTLVAEKTGLDPAMVYKTLVLTADDLSHLVCVIPVGLELDLKAVARASGHKSAAMLHQKDLLPLTGYVRGGCSPVGMKKAFPTFIDERCLSLERIAVSAGQRGMQVVLSPRDLIAVTGAKTDALCRA